MGRRGPTPTPTAILAFRGSPRAARRRGEPQSPAGPPPMPRGIPVDVRRVWRRTIADLKDAGTLCRTDGAAILRYCYNTVMLEAEHKKLTKLGSTWYAVMEDGKIHYAAPYPSVAIIRALDKELRAFEMDFGLRPSGRAGLSRPAAAASPLTVPNRKQCLTA